MLKPIQKRLVVAIHALGETFATTGPYVAVLDALVIERAWDDSLAMLGTFDRFVREWMAAHRALMTTAQVFCTSEVATGGKFVPLRWVIYPHLSLVVLAYHGKLGSHASRIIIHNVKNFPP
jgi:hypothetical protein